MDLSGGKLGPKGRSLLLALGAFLLLGLLLYLSQVPRYYREVRAVRQDISLTHTVLASFTPTPPPIASPTPARATASPLDCAPSNMFFLLALIAVVAYFTLKRRR